MKKSSCILYYAGIPNYVLSAEGLPTDISDFGIELRTDAESLIIYSADDNDDLTLTAVIINTQEGVFTDIDGVRPAFPYEMTVYSPGQPIPYSGIIFAESDEVFGKVYRVNHTNFNFKYGSVISVSTHVEDEYPPLI